MSNKKLGLILLSVAAVLVLGFGIFKLTSKKAVAPASEFDPSLQQIADQQEQNTKSDEPDNDNDLQGSVTLTTEEVKKHNSESDCWTIISGKVYDITDYVSRHSGGDEILRACGVDATSLFTQRETDTGESVGSGTPHSSSAESQLQDFLLGPVQD